MTQPRSISTYISRATFISLLLLVFGLPTRAQGNRPTANEKVNEDSIPFFRNVAVSVDLVGPLWLSLNDYGEVEGAVRVNLKDKYFPVVELGLGKSNAEDEATKITYKTSAPFVRAGLDFNIMKNKHDVYRLYAGGRYAFTSFKYEIDHPGLIDPVFGGVARYHAQDLKCSYHWLEFGIGVDAKLWGPVRLGWNVRYKRRLFHSDADEVGRTWYVPGFGKADNSEFGAMFNVIFEL